MLYIVPFGAAVMEKIIFKAFPYISVCTNYKPCGARPFMTPGTSF